MIFQYKRYGREILRPVIPVRVSYKGRSIAYEVIVDSGADVCIFDAGIGRYLGIDIEKGERFEVAGVTGAKEFYYLHPVTMQVGDVSFDTTVGFMLLNLGSFGYGAVGQYGFFHAFKVTFDLANTSIHVEPKLS